MHIHPGVLGISNKISTILPGGSQYNQFMNIFNKFLCGNEEDFDVTGVKLGDLGSHSSHKGSAMLVALGPTVSPPMSYLF